ncbi:diguanylate cyclase [bacterium]|nr:diguanylate cyclase [bacterium]MBU1993970.1 diguanylate cyclase [bacterium]
MRYYLIFFIIYEVIIGFYFYGLHVDKVDIYHQNTLTLVQNSYFTSLETYELANDNFHAQYADKLAELVKQSNGASIEKRDEIRENLLESFINFYNNKKLESLEGFHIFDKEGYSLLRFHQISKHDDPIYKFRYSLQKMKEEFLYQKGLEIGAYKESFRFQYPLFYEGDFVGSYEYSIGFDALIKQMKKFYGNKYMLVLKAKYIEDVVKPDVITKRYSKISIAKQPFYYIKSLKHDSMDERRLEYIVKLQEFGRALREDAEKVLDYQYKGESYAVVIKPVYDIEGKHVSYLLADITNTPISHFREELITEIFLASLLSLFVYIFTIRQIRQKSYARGLINIQREMLIVTDGVKIKDANDALLKFFGYKSFKDFTSRHDCVCDYFIEEEGYLSREVQGYNWAVYMQKNPDKKHKVKMFDSAQNSVKIFGLSIEKFKDNGYSFIIFRDITDELKEQETLSERANYDELTHIYNRGSFNFFLKKEIERSSRYKEVFSLIMFDIDHFKNINDNYGHDVGDLVLKELSSLVSVHVRDVDVFARWGGEEFMIISHTDLLQTEAFAEKLRKIIHEYIFSGVNKVTCSFGVAQFHENDTLESLTKKCDDMLYIAKNSGRNCVISKK